MKIWIDEKLPAPWGYYRCRTLRAAQEAIIHFSNMLGLDMVREDAIELISIGYIHDYKKFFEWLKERRAYYPIHIHQADLSIQEDIRRIIISNNWKEYFGD